MVCPQCGGEYREGYTHCANCDAGLIEPPPPPALPPIESLVKVYETGNAAVIPVLESVFQDAGIEYLAKGEGIQDLFGWGRFGTNLNYVVGPVEFYVNEEDAGEALELVQTLESSGLPADDAES
jgi:hypothetical protein